MSSEPEPPSESKAAVLAALLANVGVGISKFIAFLLTGASSMLAEAVHSVADSSNQILLLIGGRQSKQKPTRSHPFGYGRVHFLYAFMVSIVLFSLGGLFAVAQGVSKIKNPDALQSPLVAYGVLVVAIALEAWALRTVLSEARRFKPKHQSWWQYMQRTKSVNHVVLMLEDSAALIGLGLAAGGISLSLLTGNPIWDGVATLLIGGLLVAVATILFHEVKSLLIGEAADPAIENEMLQIILSVEGVDRVVDLKTLYIGPAELFIAMKVTVGSEDNAATVAWTIDEIEARLRKAFPAAEMIYVEPDLYKTSHQQQRINQQIDLMLDVEEANQKNQKT